MDVVNSAPPSFSLSGGAATATRAPALVGASQTSPRSPSFHPRVPLIAAYFRSQLAAGLATLADFVTMVALVELAGLHYVMATALGAICGGVAAFSTNRHWSFLAGHRAFGSQALRYALVWIGSLTLNCLLVYIMTDKVGLQYTWSKLLTALIVGACFNFPLHRYYVFR
jgi:putative flippase GtrA